jgi:methyltransferase (TIGR00027 family)
MPQVVILGAGFDCRIYRLSGTRSVTAFEVDHPATVAAKRSRLRTLIERLPPPHVHFVEIDFSRQSLAEVLQLAGFDSGRSTVFIWEGVTNYLTADAVDAVLRYVASCADGSRVVFTYVHRGALDGSGRFADASRIVNNVARLGEPWTFGLIPEELPSYVGDRGLRLDRDDDARLYRSTYFGKTAESMNGYDFYHVAVASVARRT